MFHSGLEVLLGENGGLLRGKRIGLVSHPAAVLPDLSSSLDALRRAGLALTTLFGMEHGFAGSGADAIPVPDGTEQRTGLPVYSLFGASKEPTPEMLSTIDVLVFDVQDVGVRFYTFASTLFYLLRAGGLHGVPLVVLDRPNPIGGVAVEGPLVEPSHESFYGIAAIPIRHGLTLGELACYFNGEYSLGADLTVVPMAGWRRALWFDETAWPGQSGAARIWVPTSPGIPHLSTAIVYPGACLLEGTNLSAGRGTGLPFEQFGAPWVDPNRLAAALNALALPGVRFRPTSFEPARRYDPRWEGDRSELCYGVQIHVTDRDQLQPVRMGLHIVDTLRRLFPNDFEWRPHFDRLIGSSRVRERLNAGIDVMEIAGAWGTDEDAFRAWRQPYLLYD